MSDPIADIRAGLSIIKLYDVGAKALALGYMIVVPSVKFEDVSAAHRETMKDLNWIEHPTYEAFGYVTTA